MSSLTLQRTNKIFFGYIDQLKSVRKRINFSICHEKPFLLSWQVTAFILNDKLEMLQAGHNFESTYRLPFLDELLIKYKRAPFP